MSVTDEQQFPQALADDPSKFWNRGTRSRKQSGHLPRVILPCLGGRKHAGQQTFGVAGTPERVSPYRFRNPQGWAKQFRDL